MDCSIQSVALLGGAFNPVHQGHLYLASRFQQSYPDTQIIFVPSSLSAHKTNNCLIKPQSRIDMLDLALKGTSWLVDDCEIRHGGVSYTVETVKYYQNKYPSLREIFILIGDDLLLGLKNWREIDYLLTFCQFVVGTREGVCFDIPPGFIALKNSIKEVSSTEIRRLVSKQQADLSADEALWLKHQLSLSLLDYIYQNKFYDKKSL